MHVKMTEIAGTYHADDIVSVVYRNCSQPEQCIKAREFSEKIYINLQFL
jgi:hypothetical protein